MYSQSKPAFILSLLLVMTGCNRTNVPSTGGPSQAGRGEEKAEAATAPRDRADFIGALVEGLARAERGERWGFVDAVGNWVIPAQYEWAESFSEGLAAVKRDGYWGYIDRQARVVIDFRYRDAARFSEQVAAVKVEQGWRYIDGEGAVRIAGPFLSARPFHEGKAWTKSETLFLYGDRVAGDFPSKDASPYMAESQEERASGLEAIAHGGEEIRAASRSNTPRLDNEVLTILYRWARSESEVAAAKWDKERGLIREPQWEEHAWRLIDRYGRSVEPSVADAEGPFLRDRDAPREPLAPERRALLVKELRHFHNIDESTDSSRVRKLQSAFETLAIQESDEAILPILRVLHRVRDRSAFFEAMRRRPSVPGPLLKALGQKSVQIRINALDTLARMSPRVDGALPRLIRALSDRDARSGLLATWALGRMGEKAHPAVGALLKRYKRDPKVVEAAVLAIGPSAVPELIRILERSPKETGIRLLSRFGAAAAPAVPLLGRFLDTPSAHVSALALTEIGVRAPPLKARIAAQFLKSLKSGNTGVRFEAASGLGRIGYDDESIRAALIAAARDESETGDENETGDEETGGGSVRLAAARSLGAFDRAASVKLLSELIDTGDCRGALRSLAALGTDAKAAAKILRQELRTVTSGDLFYSDRCGLFEATARALWKVTGDPEEALPFLIKELMPPEAAAVNWENGAEWECFEQSCDVESLTILNEMGADAAGAARRLVRYLRRAESAREAVSAVWLRIGPAVLPELTERLEKSRLAPYVTQTILHTIGELGASAATARPVLERLSSDDKNESVRGWAHDALLKINPEMSGGKGQRDHE